MEKLKYIKPKLFSTMKTYTKEQFEFVDFLAVYYPL